MEWQGWITIGVLLLLIIGLVRYAHLSDVIFLGALGLLLLLGVVTPREAIAGFSNDGVLTIGALFVVAAGLMRTGILSSITMRFLGNASTASAALRRALPMLGAASAFMNNTTVVAMGMPVMLEWAHKKRVSPSRVLLPVSYAAILGGVCTLIGTSTNLVVHGLMRESNHPSLRSGFGMWEIGAVGVPIAILGLIYLIVIAPKVLPDRREFLEQLGEARREYLAEFLVETGSPLAGRTLEEANFPGLYLVEIGRGGRILSPVGPEERLAVGDRLVFSGIVSTLVELQKIPGLTPAADLTYEISLEQQKGGRRLCEAVISTSSPLVGKSVREANFRTVYNAAVVALHRNGRPLRTKIGDARLQPGDTLLLETGTDFLRAHRNNPDFYLVSEIADASPLRVERGWIASTITIGLILLLTMPEILRPLGFSPAAIDWFDENRVTFAILSAVAMIATRCVRAGEARRSIEWSVLVTIAASFGIGTALSKSGAAALIAHGAVQPFGAYGPTSLLAGIFLITWLLTELMSNNAAAALMFPICLATASQNGLDPRPFAVAVAIGASCGFVFPAGYQTHLMVFGPGGYRVRDFVKIGIPMVILWFVTAIMLIPKFWPLTPPGSTP